MNQGSRRKRKTRLQFSQFESRIALAADFAPSVGFVGPAETNFVSITRAELMDFDSGLSAPEALHRQATAPFLLEFDEAYLFPNQLEAVTSFENDSFHSSPSDVLQHSSSDLMGTSGTAALDADTAFYSGAIEFVFRDLNDFDVDGLFKLTAINAVLDGNLDSWFGGGHVETFSVPEYGPDFGEPLTEGFAVATESSLDPLLEQWQRSEFDSNRQVDSLVVNFESPGQVLDSNDLPRHDAGFEKTSSAPATNELSVFPANESHRISDVSRTSVDRGDHGAIEVGDFKTVGEVDFNGSATTQKSRNQTKIRHDSAASSGDSSNVKDSFQATEPSSVGSDFWIGTTQSGSQAGLMTPRIRALGNQILQASKVGDRGSASAQANRQSMPVAESSNQAVLVEFHSEDLKSSGIDRAAVITAQPNPASPNVGMPIEPLLELASFDIFTAVTSDSSLLNIEEASNGKSSLAWSVVVASAAGSIGWLLAKEKFQKTDKQKVKEEQLSNAYDLTVRATVQWTG